MSESATSTRQTHTVLGGGIRYETVELVLSTIPNYELKQKTRILDLFTEIYNTFVQEIQEALDERRNTIDSLLNHNQINSSSLGEPFAFETQINNDVYHTNQTENSISHETIPKLSLVNSDQQKTSITTKPKPTANIKKEPVTPTQKIKRRPSKINSNSKRKHSSTVSPMRQMTLTQLFSRNNSPRSSENTTPIKQEPMIPTDETFLLRTDSLIGLAQPSESMSENDNEQNDGSGLITPLKNMKESNLQSLKRKFHPSPTGIDPISSNEENDQNEIHVRTSDTLMDDEQLYNACPMCRNYWLGLPEELRRKEGITCRHRQRPMARTPEHFWSLGVPDTQTCIERGYGGVLPPDKPIERPRRPRRQYQRKLKEQQYNHEQNLTDNE